MAKKPIKKPIKKTPKVFLDANVVIGAGKPPGGPEIARVVDLVEAGLISVLTTDLTTTEVAKKHVENDFETIKAISQPHFRKIVEGATGVALPVIKRPELREKLKAVYEKSTAEMFKSLEAKTLQIDDVKPSIVFDDYAAGEGFFAGDGKKDQFPDAFAFECLKGEASKKHPVIIVSSDGDFEGPVKSADHISLVKSLPELFKSLGLEMVAPELDAFFAAHKDDLVARVDKELNAWGLQSDDVMDAEVYEITANSVEITKLTAFKSIEAGGSILVVGTIEVEAMISFTHPNWDEAMYDSEDKVLIPFEDESGETEVSLTIEVAMSIAVDEGNADEIEALRFRNGDFQYVTLYPPDMYK
ncbi:PIN domain-containing protein [Sphingopyxis sp. KK2]|uniref:PIN domain-containing protein n=1 Tax=Sphingopyxis sp. KK2 TaxID=1855727 RepID=UPI00097E71C2|nr:PIN domain-containing protein [Sphingopyxis sp. KK2]